MRFDSRRGVGQLLASVFLIISYLLAPFSAFATTYTPVSVHESAAQGNVIDPNSGAESGTFQYQYTLEVPPGRNGVQPDLKLNYSSGNHDDTGFGYGWSLSIPFIERYNKSGFQNLFATTTAAFFSSLSGELVASTTSGGGGGGMSPMMSPSTSSGSTASNDSLTPIAIPPTSLGSQSATTSTSSPLLRAPAELLPRFLPAAYNSS